MNQREPTSAPLGAGQALPCLALLLLSLLAVVRAWSRPILPSQPSVVQARPYLVALGAPPLRFQEIAPPPDLVTRPPAAAPPVPATVAENSSDATPAETPAALAPTLAPVISGTPSATTDSAAAPSDEATPAPARTPPPIIRDELRPQTRPEDFLPFFQIPAGQPGDVNVVVPVPRTPASGTPLPLSSATYTQTPK